MKIRSGSTLQFYADLIDQLDMALDHLEANQPNLDRFAFMLIDNAVELFMNQCAKELQYVNRLYESLSETKYNTRFVAKANSRQFDNKVKGLSGCEVISERMSSTLLLLHRFRNSSYHAGDTHLGILNPLGCYYLETACELFSISPSFVSGAFSTCSIDDISFKSKKYLGCKFKLTDFTSKDKPRFTQPFNIIKDISVSFERNMFFALVSDMEGLIYEFDNDLDFIKTEGTPNLSRDKIIVRAQLFHFASTEAGKNLAQENNIPYTKKDYLPWLEKNRKLQFVSDPVSGWRKKLEKLKKIKHRHNALKLYCEFLDQTEQIREIISDQSAYLDHAIQDQVDHSRGK